LKSVLGERVKVLFASGHGDLIPGAIEQMRKILPELPVIVVSEFPVRGVQWFPFPMSRGYWENFALFRWRFREKHIRISAVILDPRTPYRRMRLIGFLLSPWNFLAFNENLGHFMLRPRSLGAIFHHLLWRTRALLTKEFSPGGVTYTLVWRLIHPSAFQRPWYAWLARVAGRATVALKASLPADVPGIPQSEPRLGGISVIIPSRNGRNLLADLLPEVIRQIRQIGGETIVIDNGSEDGTVDFLRQAHPCVEVLEHSDPLSFARAVNLGFRKSRFSHVCLLNNDMAIADGFFAALLAAFDQVPGLFSSTAQIFFREGARREETGKAVMPFASDRNPTDFPVRCELPLPGEDLSYVLYGSGGCSLFDAVKFNALGGLDEVYQPAYVEDLDLGFRAWQRGWPSVFVAGAEVVHRHRATTSRYYSAELLEQILEVNYLRFLVKAVADPGVFRRLWREAVERLNILSVHQGTQGPAGAALAQAWRVPLLLRRSPPAKFSDAHIFAIGSGAVIVSPGRAARGRPVVFIVTPYLPFPLAHGGAVRMYNLMRRAARDFDQVLLSFCCEPEPVPPELLEICCEVVLVKRSGSHRLPSTKRPETVEEFDSPAFHAALRQSIRKWNPGVVQLEFTQMAQYSGDCPPAKTILVEHDVTLDLYQQLLAQSDDWELRRQLKRWIPFETQAWRDVDRVITMSEKDRDLVLQNGAPAQSVRCLANGVDLERFRPSSRWADPRRILFIGSFAHLPNLLAVDFFLREAWPRLKDLRPSLHIIAGERHEYYLDRYRDRVHLDLAQPGVQVEGFVADVRPAYERATVVAAPLLASAGTNIKILEALAMGKAIVSTPAGINGLELTPGKDVIVTLSGPEMARAIRTLFENGRRRQAIEAEARRTAESRFDWNAIASEQRRLYEELTGMAELSRA
jgi:GT2 family glycosyltransferase/glycosyltransferase involved in cell wall biosynthesis